MDLKTIAMAVTDENARSELASELTIAELNAFEAYASEYSTPLSGEKKDN